jgi:capsular polysaccharide biosynthesis protein
VKNKYFDTVEVAMKDLGTMPVSTSSSKMKTILVFGVISVVAGVVVVYIKNLLDNTVKTKEDLNRITGVDLLASIDKQGGGK